MQNNSYGIYSSEKNVDGSDRYFRRMSTSGFEHPKNLYNAQHQHNFPQISESKCSNITTNMNSVYAMNGDYEKRSEMANQNFFSENNVNLLNRSQLKTLTTNTLDHRYNFVDSNTIPRFSSTPLIAQASATGHYLHNENQYNDVPMNYNQSFVPHSAYNGQTNSNTQHSQNNHSLSYMQSPYVLYDLRTNSYQNVILYSSPNPTIDHNIETNDDYFSYFSKVGNQTETNDYQDLVDLARHEPTDLNENYLKCQLNMAQDNREGNMFSKYVQDDLMYFLPPELPNDLTDLNRAESQSMPSLHGDDSAESDFDSSEDDQLNTVHGEEMLQELQKLSSVFTNVVNLPMSHNNSTIGSSNYPCHSNMSRFKKTRIKERTTFWRKERFIVKDNLVKIIPDIVANIQPMDMERLDQLEMEIFGYQIPKQMEIQEPPSSPPDCVHSTYRCRSAPMDVRFLKHSNRTSQKYRSSYNGHSPTDLSHSMNQQMSSNISSRHSHRKSLQIPVRIPIVWNSIIPMLSPVVQHRNRMFFEPTNICNGKNTKRKRRWSVSGTKFEKNCCTHGLRLHNQRQPCDPTYHVKQDSAHEYSDNRNSFDSRDFDESNEDGNSRICANLESKLDNHLVALKRTVMSYMECNLSEIRDEVRSLRGAHVNLEKQIKYYKDKVHILENSVRQNLPREQWQLYGITDSSPGCPPR